MSVSRKSSGAQPGAAPVKSDHTIFFMAGILLLGLVLRLLPMLYSISGNIVMFTGPDSYYHMRRIVYTVYHYPLSNIYDSYVNYPHGFLIAWPPLFDFISATLSLIVGLGHPDRFTMEIASSLVPVLMGLVAIILVYYILGDAINKKAGLLAALIMALLPAAAFRTIFGLVDHHALEVLISLTMYFLFLRSLALGRDEGLSFSNLTSNFTKFKKPLMYAVLAGIATACMVFSWDGAPVFISIIAAYAFIQYAYNALNGEGSEYLTISGIITALVGLVVVAPVAATGQFGQNFSFDAEYLSWFHIVFLIAIASFFVVMGLMSKALLARKAPWYALPATAFLMVAAAVLALKLFMPNFFFGIESGVQYLAGMTDIAKTVSETEPLLQVNGRFSLLLPWAYFSTAGILSIVGLMIYLLFDLPGRKMKDAETFIIVWTGIVIVLGLMQKRFIYLLAVNVSIFAGYALFKALDLAGLEEYLSSAATKKKPSSARSASISAPLLAVIAVSVVILVPILLNCISMVLTPESYSLDWNDASAWLDDHSPKTSFTYSADDGTTPEYGVMSWWDYGNYILYRAERPAVANNFQTGIKDASRYFIAPSEDVANAIMNKTDSKYVMMDFRMGSPYVGVPGGIFEDMAYLGGSDPSSYHTIAKLPNGKSTYTGDDKYYNTQYFRLFNEDGCGQWNTTMPPQNGLSNYRLEYVTSHGDPVKVFQYVPGATIAGNATPGSKVELKLKISSPYGSKTYYQFTTAGSGGEYSFIVPYPTSDSTTMIKTGQAYNITYGNTAKLVEVPASAVEDGGMINA